MSDARHFLVVVPHRPAVRPRGDGRGVRAAARRRRGRPSSRPSTGTTCTTFVPELNGAVQRFEEIDPSRHRARHRARRRRHDPARGRDHARLSASPLLGVNLGHVGFLAESERDDLGYTVGRALARDYAVEERMTLSVRAKVGDEVVYESWALNEATVEKAEPRAHARGGHRGRPAPALVVRLRRRRHVDAHRLDRLLLLRRRTRRLAEPRGARCSCRSARTRSSPDRSSSGPSRRSPSRCCSAPTAAAVIWCDGRRTLRPAARARASIVRRRRCRCGSPACTRRRSPIDS